VYNVDGDCIEFLISDESYSAERVDDFLDFLTVFYGQQTREIVGSLIKGYRKFVDNIVKSCPGFLVEISDGPVRLSHLFTAGLWKQGDPIRRVHYRKLRDSAEKTNVSVEVPSFA